MEPSIELTPEELEKRLTQELEVKNKKKSQGLGIFRFDRWIPIKEIVWGLIRSAKLDRVGKKNTLNIEVTEVLMGFETLPKELDGLRLLHISDLHCELDKSAMRAIRRSLRKLRGCYDVALVTGDYVNDTKGHIAPAMEEMQKICLEIDTPIIGVLGNHDPYSTVGPLRQMGVKVLLNDATPVHLPNRDVPLWVCGIDDPHFYKSHDLKKSHGRAPSNSFKVLLSHSPETFEQANSLGFHLHLSGHTHGGQICWPNGDPIYKNAPGCSKRQHSGAWSTGSMLGYTLRGTGSCAIPIRFFCPPEIAIHTLKHNKKTEIISKKTKP
jgi:predicted MPP superfamily phosphohydrolase